MYFLIKCLILLVLESALQLLIGMDKGPEWIAFERYLQLLREARQYHRECYHNIIILFVCHL